MLGQEFAGRVGAKAVHDVVHPFRYADLVHDFAEQGGRGGGFFGRFDNHGIAAGEGRTDFPGHQQQRQIPGTYHRDHAEWHAHAIADGRATIRCGHLEAFGGGVLDDVGEHFEVRRAARYVDM